MSIQTGVINVSGVGPDVNGQKEYYFSTPSTNTGNVLIGNIGNATFPVEPGTSPTEFQVANLNRFEFIVSGSDVLYWISKKE